MTKTVPARCGKLFGVPGTFNKAVPGKNGDFWAEQSWGSDPRRVDTHEGPMDMSVRVQFDGDGHHGHNTLAVTYESRLPSHRKDRPGTVISFGANPHAVKRHFPELEPLLAYHLCADNGPHDYPQSPIYYAGTVDALGPAYCIEIPGHQAMVVSKPFHDFCAKLIERGDRARVVQVHDPDRRPSYTFSGFNDESALAAPFVSGLVAETYAAAANAGQLRTFRDPAGRVPRGMRRSAKPRDLEAAREAAIWPDATDADLSAPASELEIALMNRLPEVIASLRTLIESAGFSWSPKTPHLSLRCSVGDDDPTP